MKKLMLLSAIAFSMILSVNGHSSYEKKFECANVWVNDAINNHLFEEGLGSVYDMGTDGSIRTDGDSMDTSLYYDTDESKYRFNVGQMGYDAKGGENLFKIKASVLENVKEAWLIIVDNGERSYRVRFFKNGTGVVTTRRKRDRNFVHLVTLDCRPGNFLEAAQEY